MNKIDRKKKSLSTFLVCNAVLVSLLIASPLDVLAYPEDGGVAPVNPLNPAVTVEPTSPPPDSYSRPEKQYETQESSVVSDSSMNSSEQEKEQVKPKVLPNKKKKTSKLQNIDKLSSYPIGNEGAILETSPSGSGGSSDFIEPITQTGQTLARLSGILIYGQKYKI